MTLTSATAELQDAFFALLCICQEGQASIPPRKVFVPALLRCIRAIENMPPDPVLRRLKGYLGLLLDSRTPFDTAVFHHPYRTRGAFHP